MPVLIEQMEQLRLPQLAGLTVLNKHLIEPDGELTPDGWAALTALASAITCFLVYKGSRPFTALLFSSYRKLTREDKRNWDTRYSSNVHAAICVYSAYLLLAQDDLFWRKDDPTPLVKRTSKYTNAALGVSVGYFLVDMVTCVKYKMGGTEMLLHHIGALLSVVAATLTGDAHVFTIWMLFTEFTTPLINNRWWLDKLEMKGTLLYTVNGVAILVAWVFARLLVFPPFFYLVWSHWEEIRLVSPLCAILIVAVPSILTCLNLYWFTKIVKGVYKVLGGKPKPKQA